MYSPLCKDLSHNTGIMALAGNVAVFMAGNTRVELEDNAEREMRKLEN